MTAIVDTPIWSEFFRRGKPDQVVHQALTDLVRHGAALLMGPVRQEILSGIKDFSKFELLRQALSAFPDVSLLPQDFERAAELHNFCRKAGVQGSNTDFLICSVSMRLGVPILTLDMDFEIFAKSGVAIQVIRP